MECVTEGGGAEVWDNALKAIVCLHGAESSVSFAAPPAAPSAKASKKAAKTSIKIDDDQSIEGFGAVVRVVLFRCADGKVGDNLCQSQLDAWIDIVSSVAPAVNVLTADVQIGKQAPQMSHKMEAKSALEGDLLNVLDARLAQYTFVCRESFGVADICAYAIVHKLAQDILGKAFWDGHPSLLRWLHTCANFPAITKCFTPLAFSAHADAWNVKPPAKKGKEKKPKGDAAKKEPKAKPAAPPAGDAKPNGTKAATPAPTPTPAAAAAAGAGAAAGASAEEDPIKKAKKAAKAAEKEAKKQKALAKKKAQAEAAAKKAAGGGAKSKKAKAAEEAALKRKKAQEEEEATIKMLSQIPAGQKKDVSQINIAGYSPRIVEMCWYSWWEKEGFFVANNKSPKPKFTIVIPPPNVTGTLHLGHALTGSVEGTIVRWKRMSGYEACWVPGTDHAGIATQTVVEKKLMREKGLTRHDLGREAFLKEVHAFARDKKSTILNQIRRLGSSVDWTRERFTMDDDLQAAVREAFCVMHEKGLIYRDARLVNWCCHLNTALSDIEVDYIDIPKRTMLSVPGHEEQVEFGCLSSFAYKFENEADGEIVVATTRIETMLGDTAVAVHPDDARYKHLHGKMLVHPINGRKIPLITDAILVDMAFGTGAVKITPAHDPNDFATGQRHKLPFINVFDDNGRINAQGGALFKGMKRFEARWKIITYLDMQGLFRGKEDNAMRLGLCSRSKDVIEPMLKPQW